ncbi:DedA family protein [Alicyclobacillus sp. SO9]|uniref:DedA family protein n=1 Tax=Alicyclobacillus sp. SO9 TaxID=2665646 RepID=UPI0018E8254B|nr:DedA family protein [Alicyclobacillus sp. SO9]
MVSHYGYLGIFLLMAIESACIPIPSEAVMTYAGFLSSLPQHPLSFWGVVVVGTLANLAGGLFIYYVGRFGGRPLILKYGKYVFLSERHLVHAEKWFAKRGELTVFVGRILPALRTFISLPAGIAEMPVGKFVLYSVLGSFPWNLALTAAGFYLGKNRHLISVYMKPLSYLGALLLLGGVIWFWSARKRPDSDKRKPDQSNQH